LGAARALFRKKGGCRRQAKGVGWRLLCSRQEPACPDRCWSSGGNGRRGGCSSNDPDKEERWTHQGDRPGSTGKKKRRIPALPALLRGSSSIPSTHAAGSPLGFEDLGKSIRWVKASKNNLMRRSSNRFAQILGRRKKKSLTLLASEKKKKKQQRRREKKKERKMGTAV